MYIRFDPEQKDSLPNCEVFYADGKAIDSDDMGWYWQACYSGSLPDGDPAGPFPTKEEAIEDARSMCY